MVRLLIADDHPIIVSGLEAVLRDTDYRVVGSVGDGARVIETVAATSPEILLLDVSMPGMCGLEILRALRAEPSPLQIVLLTAALDNADLLEAVRLGVNGIVLKESAHAQLVECLDQVRSGGRWIDRTLLQRALDLTVAGEASGDPLAALSERERIITSLVSQGLRNREIATRLGMNEGSLKVSLHRIYRKLRVENRTELAIRARGA